MSKRVTQSYTPEFRAEAVTRLNMNQGTLAYWVTQARKGMKSAVSVAGVPSAAELVAENKQLRKALAEARMESEVLKKRRRTLPGDWYPVRVREAMARGLSGQAAVPGSGGFAVWLLCLAEAAPMSPGAGE